MCVCVCVCCGRGELLAELQATHCVQGQCVCERAGGAMLKEGLWGNAEGRPATLVRGCQGWASVHGLGIVRRELWLAGV